MEKHRFGKKGILITVIAAAAAAAVIVACVISSKAAKTKMDISCISLKKTALQDTVSVTGTIRSNSSSSVYTSLTLPVKKVSVSVGDTVKKGKVLAVLDTSSLEEDIRQQQAETQAADSSISRSVQKAKSGYETALNNYNNDSGPELSAAKSSLARAKAALEQEQKAYASLKAAAAAGKATKSSLEAEAEKLSQAQQAYASAQQAEGSAKSQAQQGVQASKDAYDDAMAKSSDKSGDTALQKLQDQMKQSVIKAPMDGTVTQCGASVGDVPKTAMFRIENTSDLVVDAEVKEIDINRVKNGDKVTVTTDATGKETVPGEVVRIAPAATGQGDAQQAAQGSDPTFTVKINITGKNPKLKIGMKAKANIVLEEKQNAFVLPYDSIVQKSNGSNIIYVAEPYGALYKVAEVPVTMGLETDVSAEVSGAGLKNGTKVITETDGISPGQTVQLSPSPSSRGK